jgi:hypothetical protein
MGARVGTARLRCYVNARSLALLAMCAVSGRVSGGRWWVIESGYAREVREAEKT